MTEGHGAQLSDKVAVENAAAGEQRVDVAGEIYRGRRRGDEAEHPGCDETPDSPMPELIRTRWTDESRAMKLVMFHHILVDLGDQTSFKQGDNVRVCNAITKRPVFGLTGLLECVIVGCGKTVQLRRDLRR